MWQDSENSPPNLEGDFRAPALAGNLESGLQTVAGGLVGEDVPRFFGNDTAGLERRQTCGIDIGNNRVFETDVRIVAERGRFVLRIGIQQLVDQVGRKTSRRQCVATRTFADQEYHQPGLETFGDVLGYFDAAVTDNDRLACRQVSGIEAVREYV